jgi:hypothetical protein
VELTQGMQTLPVPSGLGSVAQNKMLVGGLLEWSITDNPEVLHTSPTRPKLGPPIFWVLNPLEWKQQLASGGMIPQFRF